MRRDRAVVDDAAAAALLALLFVAASIGAGYMSADRGSPTRTFTTPVVFHYTFVLLLSLVALVPQTPRLAGDHHWIEHGGGAG